MADYRKCIDRIIRAAGHKLTDEQVANVFERIHQAALDLKKGKQPPKISKRSAQAMGIQAHQGPAMRTAIVEAAQYAMVDMVREAELKLAQANLQVLKLAARKADIDKLHTSGQTPIDAVRRLIARDYSSRTNVTSLEQQVRGTQDYYRLKVVDTWDALGDDFLGYFQDETKMLNLVRELRGESTGDAMAKKGAEAFHKAAEEARTQFNDVGGQIGKLDDWGMPQHHSQERVAAAGNSPDPAANRQAWVDAVLPLIDRGRYTDDLGAPWDEARMREFLGKAWDNIATDGWASTEPGQFRGTGKRANRHAESRQIHFKDADSVIEYWRRFGERTVAEILLDHIDTMARDIAFLDRFGPNPDITYRTLADEATKKAITANPRRTESIEGQRRRLDELYDYAAGRIKPSANTTVSGIADAIANLNVAGKLGGAAIASFFGDKPMMEAVSHLNNMPIIQRWQTELATFNPTNAADRRALMREGLMLDTVRSSLNRFYDGLGKADTTGKIANAVMRMTGMQAVNDFRKASFGAMLYSSIGNEIAAGKTFAQLAQSDVRTLRNYGITETDWNTWRLAKLDTVKVGSAELQNNLTPSSIAAISEADLRAQNIIGAADGPEQAAAVKRQAIVKLLGAVNTESEFAVVTPGWTERSLFYGSLQRGTALGEISRSILQFKSFPWAYFQRAMDAIANAEGPAPKAAMVAYIIASSALAGAMILQTREMLAGKDPRKMLDDDWKKFWGAAFLQGGALGIYGDFLYSANQTRYGSGLLEAMAGPTLGPLTEVFLTQPAGAIRKAMEGKESQIAAQTVQDLKGFVPGGNIWYTKAALDHLIWQNVMESLSPGYLRNMRNRTMKEFNQEWWWNPGEATPERLPNVEQAFQP